MNSKNTYFVSIYQVTLENRYKEKCIPKKEISTRMGFEPTRAEHNGLAVHRLNHSATSSPNAYRIFSKNYFV